MEGIEGTFSDIPCAVNAPTNASGERDCIHAYTKRAPRAVRNMCAGVIGGRYDVVSYLKGQPQRGLAKQQGLVLHNDLHNDYKTQDNTRLGNTKTMQMASSATSAACGAQALVASVLVLQAPPSHADAPHAHWHTHC